MSNRGSDHLNWAMDYISRGWHLFPLRPGSKVPATPNGFHNATQVAEKIEGWFKGGNHNIGIATGSTSGLVVIDDDCYKPGGSDLRGLEQQHGALPETYTVKTRAGGRQYYFRYCSSQTRIKCSTGKIGSHIDIRAEGGYVVAPPSFVVEDSKWPAGYYEIALDAGLAELPQDWVSLLAQQKSAPAIVPPLKTGFSENAGNIDVVKQCLSALNADCDRDQWRDICYTGGALVHLHGWRYETVLELYDDWSKTAGERYDQAGELPKFLTNYDPARDKRIDIGSLFFRSGIRPVSVSAASSKIPSDIRGGDLGNAEWFAALYRDQVLFVTETKEWLKYDAGAGWTRATEEHLQQLVKGLIADMYQRASALATANPDSIELKKLRTEAQRLTQKTPIDNLLNLAAREPGMSVSMSQFDRDGMQLGVCNGVIDLKKQELRSFSPDGLLTKRCNAAFDRQATCSRWLRFLRKVQPDPPVQDYLQRLAGLIALGVHRERAIFFMYGVGANGKSVFIETLAYVLGEYAVKIPTDLLMSHKRDPQGASPEFLLLRGARLSYCNETSEGARLDDARVKDFTGGDTISARPLYSSRFVTFQPSHTLVMVGNHRPVIRDSSNATWDRMQLVPFSQTIPDTRRDRTLMEQLKAESSGILNWVLTGVRMYLDGGLKPPAIVQDATRAYEEEQDVVGEWIAERCLISSGESEEKRKIQYSFDVWCRANGYHQLSSRRLTQDLEKRGVTRSSCKRKYLGISIKQDDLIAAE